MAFDAIRVCYLPSGSIDLWLQVKSAAVLNVDAIEGRAEPSAPWTPLLWRVSNATEGRYQIHQDGAQRIDQIRIHLRPDKSAKLDAIELRPVQITR